MTTTPERIHGGRGAGGETTGATDMTTQQTESQLAQRFDAADMATAAAQGVRDGGAKEQQAMWRHIETAPKDGQAILVTDGMDCYCVEWDEELDWWTGDDNKLGPFRLRGSAPTHWMKLPEAPNA